MLVLHFILRDIGSGVEKWGWSARKDGQVGKRIYETGRYNQEPWRDCQWHIR